MIKFLKIFMTVIGISLVTIVSSFSAEIKVVTSFSILADLAKNVGGERVEIISLVGPDGDAHSYEPKPTDAQNIKNADVILVNGLNLEGFMTRLIKASGTDAPVIELSKGIVPIKNENDDHHHHHDHGEFDPHAWQSVVNAEIYVKNVTESFCTVDVEGCDTYKNNAQEYTKKMKLLDKKIRSEISQIPDDKKTIITSHDAFGYFAQEYGLIFLAPQGVSTESEATASSVAKLITQIKADKASALFIENISNKRLIEQIAKETGLKISGQLYSDALSSVSGPASTYINMMEHNLNTIITAIH
ncbi:metal ABC transporter substrate-binding protein [Bartonella tamiae]|uniref:Periplasmic solute binding protein n=1 Tax=Bartonella tamiae Th239 TaxID=1094558 RepID=J0ZPP2_9HYPH|nr:metal ABC transporter substrate-binding protein [Bartonella tamiae]EJF90563.1 hypothetical protein ME5_00964 [Bartonella tamiae Th239]EJF94059.1 hypothetical protein MEG_00917 [Bartonella tamiae Th307]